MNYQGNYRCWTVICKTKECGQTLFACQLSTHFKQDDRMSKWETA